MFALRKKTIFDGKPKMTKNFEFQNLKIPRSAFSNFEIQFFLSFLVSHQQNVVFLEAKNTFVIPKIVLD